MIGGATGSAGGGSVVPSANGNIFDYSGVKAFASGGSFTNSLVSSPTMFPLGLMGEAGPEAIMPLSRDSKGRLGVSGGGGTSLQQVNQIGIEITTVIQGDGNSQSSKSSNDTAKQYDKFSALIAAKVKEVITEEQRQGGALYAGG